MIEVASSVPVAVSPSSRRITDGCSAASMLGLGADRQAMEGIAMPPRSIKAGTELVREGDQSDQLYLLLDGWACRYKTTRDGNRQIVALVVPGDFANLDALMFGSPDYGVRVLSSATVSTLRCDRVLALADQHRGIAKALTRLVYMENAILRQQAFCLGRYPAQKKLAHLLCELAMLDNAVLKEAAAKNW